MEAVIEYKAETEEDIVMLCDCVQKAMSVSRAAEKLISVNEEYYYELEDAFELIRALLKPVDTFLSYDAIDYLKAALEPDEHKPFTGGIGI